MKLPLLFCLLLPLVAAYENYDSELISTLVNGQRSTWQAGHSARFHGKPRKFLQRQLGANLEKDRILRRSLPLRDNKYITTAIPDSFDAREHWPKCRAMIDNIRDQSSCGSCWAVAATGAMSDRVCVASDGEVTVSVSAKHLMACCWQCGFGCEGGFAHEAWKYFAEVGLVTGEEYDQGGGCQPYPFPECEHHNNHTSYKPCSGDYNTPMCNRQCQTNYTKGFEDDKHHGIDAYLLPADVEAIQKDIMTYGSAETGFTVYSDFPSYTSGVYQHVTGGPEGGHDVRMIGWGTENGTPYWLIANSWNADWGDKGYFKILRGQDECGIESSVVAGRVKG